MGLHKSFKVYGFRSMWPGVLASYRLIRCPDPARFGRCAQGASSHCPQLSRCELAQGRVFRPQARSRLPPWIRATGGIAGRPHGSPPFAGNAANIPPSGKIEPSCTERACFRPSPAPASPDRCLASTCSCCSGAKFGNQHALSWSPCFSDPGPGPLSGSSCNRSQAGLQRATVSFGLSAAAGR